MDNINNVNIRPFKLDKDEDLIYNIWRNTIGDVWSLDIYIFNQIIKNKEHYKEGHFVAEKDGNVIGFVATHAKGDTSELTLVLVDKKYQRIGIGKQLLNRELV